VWLQLVSGTSHLMELDNSYLDFYREMISELYRDIAQCYGVSSSLQKVELRVIASRLSSEGISFLTKTLPTYGKALDRALSSGSRFSVLGLRKESESSVIPKLFGWLLKRVISTAGFELDQPDPIALLHFRQLTHLLYKLEITYAPKTAQAVVDAFVKTETDLAEVAGFDFGVEWIVQARDIITRVVSPVDPQGIKPKHGPGSVATGESVCEKTVFKRIYSTLEKVYPFTEWMAFNLNHVVDSCHGYPDALTEIPEPTAKVVLVPKDSRGPRLISCEPLELMWIQQGLGTALQDQIESSRWTRGFVNFTDQETNRRLSLESSKTAEWVTLDMKEASDRVSLQLVEKLFAGHPTLLDALKATRSTATKLPDGTVLTLKKFAPMGSKLCFPVESLVFYALAVSAVKQTGVSWREARRSVYVYGDDIIVKKKDYNILLQLFPLVGLMFNDAKCCTARSFRESCGCDAYEGVDVTPVKLKTVWSCHRTKGPEELQSYVAFSNAMYGRGYSRVADYVKRRIESLYGVLPLTNRFITTRNGSYVAQSAACAWVSRTPATLGNKLLGVQSRFNRYLHFDEYRSWSSTPKRVKTEIDGYQEWLRRLSDGFGAHGGSYALVRRNRLKRTWMQA